MTWDDSARAAGAGSGLGGGLDGGLDEDLLAVTAKIDDQIRQAGRHADEMQQWSADVDALTGEGSALRQGVRVTVNNSGVVTSLRVTDAACDVGGPELSRAIMQALAAAQKAVGDAVARTAADRFGRESEVTRLMAEDLSTRLGVAIDLDDPRSTQDPRGRYPRREGGSR